MKRKLAAAVFSLLCVGAEAAPYSEPPETSVNRVCIMAGEAVARIGANRDSGWSRQQAIDNVRQTSPPSVLSSFIDMVNIMYDNPTYNGESAQADFVAGCIYKPKKTVKPNM